MLNENEKLYQKLTDSLQNPYTELRAVYEPENTGIEDNIFNNCYSAAVDLFRPGMTFRIWFTHENGKIEIIHAERWFFG